MLQIAQTKLQTDQHNQHKSIKYVSINMPQKQQARTDLCTHPKIKIQTQNTAIATNQKQHTENMEHLNRLLQNMHSCKATTMSDYNNVVTSALHQMTHLHLHLSNFQLQDVSISLDTGFILTSRSSFSQSSSRLATGLGWTPNTNASLQPPCMPLIFKSDHQTSLKRASVHSGRHRSSHPSHHE